MAKKKEEAQTINMDLFRAVVTAQTKKLNKLLVGSTSKKDKALTEEEIDIKETYDSLYCGGSRDTYKKKIEAQFKRAGKELNPKVFEESKEGARSHDPIPLAAFVPISNPNNHSYTLDKIAVYVGLNEVAYAPDRKATGNYMSGEVSSKREAYKEEIATLTLEDAAKIIRLSTLSESLFYNKNTKENVATILGSL